MAQRILIPLTYELELQKGKPAWREPKYRRVLVPLDGSPGADRAEGALIMAQELLPPGGKGILLRIIPPGNAEQSSDNPSLRSKRLEARRAGALGYLRCVVGHLTKEPGRWRCEVVVSDSVPDAIAELAIREEVDLIAMYSHERKGLAKLIKGSIAEKVQQKATMDLRVLRQRDLISRRPFSVDHV